MAPATGVSAPWILREGFAGVLVHDVLVVIHEGAELSRGQVLVSRHLGGGLGSFESVLKL